MVPPLTFTWGATLVHGGDFLNMSNFNHPMCMLKMPPKGPKNDQFMGCIAAQDYPQHLPRHGTHEQFHTSEVALPLCREWARDGKGLELTFWKPHVCVFGADD